MTNADQTGDLLRHLPLRTPVLHILLALGRETLHGYGIMQGVRDKTRGTARILPGTLYTTLSRMLEDGLLEEVSAPAHEPDDDRRSRYYRATRFGHDVLAAELARMAMLVQVGERDLKPS